MTEIHYQTKHRSLYESLLYLEVYYSLLKGKALTIRFETSYL